MQMWFIMNGRIPTLFNRQHKHGDIALSRSFHKLSAEAAWWGQLVRMGRITQHTHWLLCIHHRNPNMDYLVWSYKQKNHLYVRLGRSSINSDSVGNRRLNRLRINESSMEQTSSLLWYPIWYAFKPFDRGLTWLAPSCFLLVSTEFGRKN